MKSYLWTDRDTGEQMKIELESDGELSWDFTHIYPGHNRIGILVRAIWDLRQRNIDLESAVYDLQEKSE